MSQKDQSENSVQDGAGNQQEGVIEVDLSTSKATTSHVTRDDVDKKESSSGPAFIINWSPESNRNFNSSFEDPSPDSPTPSSRSPPLSTDAQRGLEGLGRVSKAPLSSARNSSDSSSEMVEHGSPVSHFSSPSSAAASPPDSRSRPAICFFSPVSLRNTSIPSLDLPPHLAISVSPLTSKAVRARAFSAIIPRHPSTLGSRSFLPPEGDSIDWSRRRASHDGNVVRARTSLSPILSPILDVRDETTLNPAASTFEFPAKIHCVDFSADASFDFIVVHGKNTVGDMSREARTALGKIGLKSIPSLHGPLSLPYARCPSGIDAFLFSHHKDEDPWTFILDSEPRRPRHSSAFRTNQVPLPGNARYSQPAHILQGRLPNRIVSAPAALGWKDDGSDKTSLRVLGPKQRSRVVSNASTVGSRTLEPAISSQENFAYPSAQYNRLASPQLDLDYGSAGLSYASDVETYPGPTAPLPPFPQPTLPPPYPYPYPYSWPTAPVTFPAFPVPSYYPPYAMPPPFGQTPSMYPAPLTTQAPPLLNTGSFVDPAIVSFGNQQQAHVDDLTIGADSSYHTAPEEDDEEETDEEVEHGGFFFPALPPQSFRTSRRDSSSSQTTTIKGGGPGSRRPSIRTPSVPLAPLASLVAKRRNSAAAGPRRMSLAPAVTVSPRRSSITSHTRLASDHHQKEAKAARQPRPPPTSPPAPPPAAQPQPPPQTSLVPHHTRPHLTSTFKVLARNASSLVPGTSVVVEVETKPVAPIARPPPIVAPKKAGKEEVVDDWGTWESVVGDPATFAATHGWGKSFVEAEASSWVAPSRTSDSENRERGRGKGKSRGRGRGRGSWGAQ